MLKKDFYQILPVIFLAFFIALSPSFIVGRVEGGRALELRLEDFLIIILGIIWFVNFLVSGRAKIKKPSLLFPILLWLGIGLFSVLTNWIFMNIYLWRGFFYFLKEIEFFFIYFYVFYHIKSFDSVKFLLQIWVILGLINVGWIIYQLISGAKITYYYGPTPFIEPEGTFPGGGFFLIIFTFLFNVLLYYYFDLSTSYSKKILISFITISPAIGVLSSGSRASFIGLIFSVFLSFLFYSLKKGFLKSFLVIFLLISMITGTFLFFGKSLPLQRFFNIESFLWNLDPKHLLSRPGVWITQLSQFLKHPLFLVFGLGKSALLVYSESHSQYVRNFIETGIIGSIVFLLLMYIIIKYAVKGLLFKKDKLIIGLSAGLLVGTLAMMIISISAEAFIVVKISEVYWFFVALTMATLSLNKTAEDNRNYA